jgi:hypothetical protein
VFEQSTENITWWCWGYKMQETEMGWVCTWDGRDGTLNFAGVNDSGKTEMEMEYDTNVQK